MCLLVGLLVGGGCSAAFAQWKSPPPDIRLRGPNNLPFNYSTGKYVGFGGGTGGGASLNSTYEGRLAGALVPIQGARTIPASALARLGVRLAKASGPVGLGFTLADLVWDEVNLRWLKQEELETPQDSHYWYSPGNDACPPSGTCSFTEAANAICSPPTGLPGSVFVQVRTIGVDWVEVYCSRPPNTGVNEAFTMTVNRTPTPRDLEMVPATDAEIQEAILSELVSGSLGDGLAEKLHQFGLESELLHDAGPQHLSGPSSVQGPSSTSTTSGPAGQTTVTTNTTYYITYQGDTITITENITKTTVSPTGETTTESSTQIPTPEQGVEVPPEDPQKTDCEKFPDASGCQELGDPEDYDLQTEQRSVIWSQEGGAAGSCPADKPFSLPFGHSASLSWQPLCDFATGIRPFVIGLAWLSAGIFVFMVARERP